MFLGCNHEKAESILLHECQISLSKIFYLRMEGDSACIVPTLMVPSDYRLIDSWRHSTDNVESFVSHLLEACAQIRKWRVW